MTKHRRILLWACLGSICILGLPLVYCLSYENLVDLDIPWARHWDPFHELRSGMDSAQVAEYVGMPTAIFPAQEHGTVPGRSAAGSLPASRDTIWYYRRNCARNVEVRFDSNGHVTQVVRRDRLTFLQAATRGTDQSIDGTEHSSSARYAPEGSPAVSGYRESCECLGVGVQGRLKGSR